VIFTFFSYFHRLLGYVSHLPKGEEMKLLCKKKLRLPSVVPLALVLALVSCGGDATKTADSAPCASADAITAAATYDSLWTNVFENRCGTCHGSASTGTEDGPDLRTKAGFLSNLVSKTAANYGTWTELASKSKCLALSLIDPNNSKKSLVVGVLDPSTTLPSECVVSNHKIAPQNICISSGSLTNLKAWIDGGAK
jgi:hypothetical protein